MFDPYNPPAKQYNKNPSDIEYDKDIFNKFGCFEIEKAINCVIQWMKDGNKSFDALFTIKTIPNLSSEDFALLCACGWITHPWFPMKYLFRLSDKCLTRIGIEEKV